MVIFFIIQHLRETYPQPRESDLSPTLLTFMYNVALAQAQECILEKSMTDNRKPTIIGTALLLDPVLLGCVKGFLVFKFLPNMIQKNVLDSI